MPNNYPNFTNYRACGISILPEEGAGWFPGDELKEFYSLGDYEDTKMETLLLGHKSDGSEGILFSKIPPYVKENGQNGKGKTSPTDDEEVGICMNATPSC